MATKAAPAGPLIPGTACLTAKDLKSLNDLLQSCSDTQCLLDALNQLGIDVSALSAENQAQKSFATATKAQQFPNAP